MQQCVWGFDMEIGRMFAWPVTWTERDDFADGRIWLMKRLDDLYLELCPMLMRRHKLAGRLTDEGRLRCVHCTRLETTLLTMLCLTV